MIRLSDVNIPSVSSFDKPELLRAQIETIPGRLKVERGVWMVGRGSVWKNISPALHKAVDAQITQVDATSRNSNRLQAIAASNAIRT